MTTWTTAHVPPREPGPPDGRPPALRPAWDCTNCGLLNPGPRKRCTDCRTRRDLP